MTNGGSETGVHEAEVDGVPAFWVDDAGPFTAGLVFGAAQWHEPILDRGLTHLVEHLALHGVGPVPYDHNGQVDLIGTAFLVRGEPSEAATFLSRAAQMLAALPVDRLEHEARVLAAESAMRGPTPVGAIGLMRWGLAGPGVLDAPEYALRTATPERVDAWRRRFFVRENAALWLSGAPPAGLDLSALASGERVRAALPAAVDSTTCYDTWAAPRYSFMAVVERTPGAPAGAAMLQEWLMTHVRDGAGGAYSVFADYLPVTATEALAVVSVDAPPHDLPRSWDAIQDALEALCRDGFDDASLDLYRERTRRAEAAQPIARAASSAMSFVSGRDDPTDGSWREQLRAMTAADVTHVVRGWLDRVQWIVPHEGRPSLERGPLPQHLPWRDDSLGVNARLLAKHPTEPETYDIEIGDDGVALRYGGDTSFVIPFDEVAVMRRYDDGTRILHHTDGTAIVYDPYRWGEPPQLGEWLDHRCASKLVPMGPRPSG